MSPALNVSRQAVIKTLVRQTLDQHYLAQRATAAGASQRVGRGVHFWGRSNVN